MTNPRATIADALNEHDLDDYCDDNEDGTITSGLHCLKCGWKGITQRDANGHLAEIVIQQLRDAGYHITNQGTPNQPYKYPDDDIQCPCGDTVPANIAYRDGPQPFHWNNEGGGHTTDPETWKRWKQQETENDPTC